MQIFHHDHIFASKLACHREFGFAQVGEKELISMLEVSGARKAKATQVHQQCTLVTLAVWSKTIQA
jgi:hypothetical protein